VFSQQLHHRHEQQHDLHNSDHFHGEHSLDACNSASVVGSLHWDDFKVCNFLLLKSYLTSAIKAIKDIKAH
jgi:hypothetical protein